MHRSIHVGKKTTITLIGGFILCWGLLAQFQFSFSCFPAITLYLVSFAIMVLLYKSWSYRFSFTGIWIAGIVVRFIMFLYFPASDDVNRYLWEGFIQQNGYNPYTNAPDQTILESVQSKPFENINHKQIPSLYQPVIMLVCYIASIIGLSPLSLKVIVVFFDLGTALILAAICKKHTIKQANLILYLFNPLVIFYTAGEGHLEIVYVFFITLSLYYYFCNKDLFVMVFTGVAASTKILALIFIPFITSRKNFKLIPYVSIPFFILSIPYIPEVFNQFRSLNHFASAYHFNGFFYTLFSSFVSHEKAINLSNLTFIAALISLWLYTPDRIKAASTAFGILLLCMTTMHPWYLMILTPFMVLTKPSAWLVLQATAIVVMNIYAKFWTHGIWAESTTLFLLEYVPFIIVALSGLIRVDIKKTYSFSTLSFQVLKSTRLIPFMQTKKQLTRIKEL